MCNSLDGVGWISGITALEGQVCQLAHTDVTVSLIPADIGDEGWHKGLERRRRGGGNLGEKLGAKGGDQREREGATGSIYVKRERASRRAGLASPHLPMPYHTIPYQTGSTSVLPEIKLTIEFLDWST
jgi:hypothetical protein